MLPCAVVSTMFKYLNKNNMNERHATREAQVETTYMGEVNALYAES